MSRTTRLRDLILGVLFFGALFALAWVTTQLRSLPGVRKSVFLNVFLENANGVRREDSVLVFGTRLGRVHAVRPIPEEAWRATGRDLGAEGLARPGFRPNVLMVLELHQPLELRAGYRIDAADANLLGGKEVRVDPGPFDAPALDPGSGRSDLDPTNSHDLALVRLVGAPREHPIAAIGRVVDQNSASFHEIVENVRKMSVSLAGETGVLGYLIHNPEAKRKGENVLAALDELADQSRRPGSLVNDLFYDGPLRQDALATVREARDFVADARDPKSLVGALIVPDSDMRKRTDQILRDVADFTTRLRSEKSLLGKITAEGPDSLGATTERIANQIDRWVGDAMDNPDSLVHRLAYGDTGATLDRALGKVDREISRFSTAILDPIEQGKGLVGYVINDPESRQKLERLINATLGIVEDAREAAPISSLGSFIFGAF